MASRTRSCCAATRPAAARLTPRPRPGSPGTRSPHPLAGAGEASGDASPQRFLRLLDRVELDHLLLDLAGHVGLDILVEPRLPLPSALPDFPDGEPARAGVRGVHDEARLLLHQRHKMRRRLVISGLVHPGCGHPHQYGHWTPPCQDCVPGPRSYAAAAAAKANRPSGGCQAPGSGRVHPRRRSRYP